MKQRHLQNLRLLLLLAAAPALHSSEVLAQDSPGDSTQSLWGHSAHGEVYDEGPRQRPWIMEGIGHVSFPISSSHADVQRWFDQAVTLMHGFWWYEAERSLRWCLKLDPECAMAYWALSIATQQNGDSDRRDEFLAEASRRKAKVTPRERAFIEVAEKFQAIQKSKAEDAKAEAQHEAMQAIDRLLMDYPDDLEAKALYWLLSSEAIGYEQLGMVRYGMEAVLDDILEVDPDHVGAHHYRVHTWDGKEGRYAVDTCMKLAGIAPECGHLLHMPGHVLSSIGLWHEAAIAMDGATRVEKRYMNTRMILPEHNWNYVHNLDYLGYIQEQLGLLEQALIGAEQLLLAPAFMDKPRFQSMVKNPTVRALVKFQRWEELLESKRVPWNLEEPGERMAADTARLRALIGLDRIEEAEQLFESIQTELADGGQGAEGNAKEDDEFFARMLRRQTEARMKALEGMLLLAKGERLAGLSMLTRAAEEQEEGWQNDPPRDGEYLYNFLGDTYLELGSPVLAVECFEKTLETIFNDGFALAGLVVAHAQLGETELAEQTMAKLKVVWSDADRPNRWLAAAEATGITAEPHLAGPIQQRNYKSEVLDIQGPSLWVRSALPALSVVNAMGQPVTLEDYVGENVILIFYLGDECVHCMEQIQVAEQHLDSLAERDAVVLAVSRDSVDEIREQQNGLGVVLLSDEGFENARRFHSFDDFEDIELHSTFLIDRAGRLHWSRIGGAPFTEFDYLEQELDRLNRATDSPLVSAGTEDSSLPPREAGGQ